MRINILLLLLSLTNLNVFVSRYLPVIFTKASSFFRSFECVIVYSIISDSPYHLHNSIVFSWFQLNWRSSIFLLNICATLFKDSHSLFILYHEFSQNMIILNGLSIIYLSKLVIYCWRRSLVFLCLCSLCHDIDIVHVSNIVLTIICFFENIKR